LIDPHAQSIYNIESARFYKPKKIKDLQL